jgi:hypothetical protein
VQSAEFWSIRVLIPVIFYTVGFTNFFVVSKKADDQFVIGMNKLGTSVVDPDLGSGCFLTPGSGMEKKSGIRDPGFRIRNPGSTSQIIFPFPRA